jgi:hypothetical protein
LSCLGVREFGLKNKTKKKRDDDSIEEKKEEGNAQERK